MAAIQTQFDQFHAAVKLDEDNEKAKLREKRDTLIKELRERLPEDAPSFEYFHQGSYSMHTGVVPLNGNYDIDVGLIFDCKRDKYADPVELKKIVRDALSNGNRTVDIRRPCVTVTYMRDGTPIYHVDLAIYVKRDDSYLDLAMGKENSDAEKRYWQVSDPKTLTSKITGRFSDDDAAQYRRCIRALKRWRCEKFSTGGPLSIAITTAAHQWFQPAKSVSGKYLDLIALKNLTATMLVQFSDTEHDGEIANRLKVYLPVTPNNDLMAGMTNIQMSDFKGKLKALNDALKSAEAEELPEVACATLQKHFGDDFPVPDKNETAKSVKAPYISTGASA